MIKIKGVAVQPGRIDCMDGLTQEYTEQGLRDAVGSLVGKPISTNFSRDVEDHVGHVTDAWYEDGTGIVYEAEITDPEVVDLDVHDIAPRLYHSVLDEDDPEVRNIMFDRLGVVSVSSPIVGDAWEVDPSPLTISEWIDRR